MPLFPLNTVLFPYASLHLHVFEERYRSMIQNCMAFDRPFGVVLIRSGSEIGELADPYLVGTAVRIVSVQTFDDGAMDIQVQGERRFRIRELDESGTYLVGKVEPVVEHPMEGSERADELMVRAREAFETLIQRLFSRQEISVQVVFPTDPVVLSFTIANLLPMENLDKQKLLETTDTLERVEDLLPILDNQILEAKQPAYYPIGTEDLKDWITPN